MLGVAVKKQSSKGAMPGCRKSFADCPILRSPGAERRFWVMLGQLLSPSQACRQRCNRYRQAAIYSENQGLPFIDCGAQLSFSYPRGNAAGSK
jgi:hypothetical protein